MATGITKTYYFVVSGREIIDDCESYMDALSRSSLLPKGDVLTMRGKTVKLAIRHASRDKAMIPSKDLVAKLGMKWTY